MRFTTLDDWLEWQQTLHPNPIDLGLQRVAAVWHELRPKGLQCRVISVAGTNGKGSCVALAERIAREGGLTTGAYTSPHLLRYTERIRLNGEEIAGQVLCAVFERIDQARQRCFNADGSAVTLSYFEFATLAALECFAEAEVDITVLEVGLGGRLDAVNIVDADAAIISSISIDHVAWLGSDVNVIGAEKVGIARKGRPLVLAMPTPPEGLLGVAKSIGADVLRVGDEFTADLIESGWRYERANQKFDLPLPALSGDFQRRHAAAVITALYEVGALPDRAKIAVGLQQVRITARQQLLSVRNSQNQLVDVLVDVAHNADSANALANGLRVINGKRTAVVGILADKALSDIIQPLLPKVDAWFCCTPDNSRALAADDLVEQMMLEFGVEALAIDSPEQAVTSVLAQQGPGDEICLFGSFYTVAAALPYLQSRSS